MIVERLLERDRGGRAVRVLERQLAPEEELVELTWRSLRRQLLAVPPAAKALTITLGPLPAGSEPRALIDGLCDRIVREGFPGTQWETFTFVEVGS